MKKIFIIILLFCSIFCFAQNPDTLYVNYYSNSPFSFSENSTEKGIEVDLINQYVVWLRSKKKMNIVIKYRGFSDFSSFYTTTKTAGKNTMGMGSVTINTERSKEIDFSKAYLKNVAFCITNGNAPDIKNKTPDEIMRTLGSMTALTIANTTLSKYVGEIKKTYIQDLKISYETDEKKILDEISKNVLNFGYLDAIGFWMYLKSNPHRFLKMQKILSQAKEELGFVMPKGSPHKLLFSEFFDGPTGFKNGRGYHEILEKYLGAYMTQNMAIN